VNASSSLTFSNIRGGVLVVGVAYDREMFGPDMAVKPLSLENPARRQGQGPIPPLSSPITVEK
jgi:hypothetical protein